MANITGTGGNDTITPGLSTVGAVPTAANDSIAGLDGNDSLNGGGGLDTLDGGLGNDTLFGGAGGGLLSGGEGDDFVFQGSGNETLSGGAGRDSAFFEITTGAVVIDLTAGTATGLGVGSDLLSGFEDVHGSFNFADSITGSAVAESLWGRGSNDTLRGLDGSDTFFGGSGADLLDGGSAIDWANYFDDGFDTAGPGSRGVVVNLSAATRVFGTSTVAGGTALDNWGAVDTLVSIENLIGSGLGDTLIGDGGDNHIDGSAGNDLIEGGAGNDTLIGGAGDDVFIQATGNDSINGGGGFFDRVSYAPQAFAVSVTVNALGGATVNKGVNGTDTITGVVVFEGGGGNDSFNAAALTINPFRNYYFRGGNGDDTITGSGSFFTVADYSTSSFGVNVDLQAGTASDGLGGADTLVNIRAVQGGSGNDTLFGSNATGNDNFTGSIGNDSIDGRAGFDFVSYFGLGGGVAFALTGPGFGTAVKGVGGALGTDGLSSIEGFQGTNGFADSFVGTTVAGGQQVWFEGYGGNDSFDGKFNTANLLNYSSAQSAVTVNLQTGLATDGWGGTDNLTAVAALRTSNLADTIIGLSTATWLVYLDGAGGNDTINGAGNSFNIADYNNGSGITADLVLGTVNAGGATDTLVNVRGLRGSGANDSIAGATGNWRLDAGFGFDVLNYGALAGPITVNLDLNNAGTVNKGADGIDTIAGFEQVIGTAGNDTFNGSSSATFTNLVGMVGGAGNDVFNGFGRFWNAVDYRLAAGGVTVNLGGAAGTAQDGQGGTDTLNNVVYVYGSDNADSLKGGTTADTFSPGRGNDTIDGDAGFDSLDYTRFGFSSGLSLVATFTGNTAGTVVLSGGAGNQSFTNIERIRATGGNDVLTGTTLTTGTTITLEGDNGNDTIDGQNSQRNFVSYSSSFNTVTVDLAAKTANDGWGAVDTLNNVVRVGGGSASDNIAGAATDDWFVASNGNDSYSGRAGIDLLEYTGMSGPHTIIFTADGAGTVAKNNNGTLSTDTFSGIEIIQGSNGNDSITGFAGATVDTFLRGGLGNDTINAGGNVRNIADYTGGNAITANLATGAVTGGQGSDSLQGVLAIRGSAFNDTFRTGGSGSYVIQGGTSATGFGTDTLDGALAGVVSNVVVTMTGSNAGTMQKNLVAGGSATDSFSFVTNTFGTAGDDRFNGSSGLGNFRGLAGNDTLDGQATTNNFFSFFDSPNGIVARLQDSIDGSGNRIGYILDGWQKPGEPAGTYFRDSTINVLNIGTSQIGSDDVVGGDLNDSFSGSSGGNDRFDGGSGFNTVSYSNLNFAPISTVQINVTNPVAGLYGGGSATVTKTPVAGGTAFTDTLVNINEIRGTGGADQIFGYSGVYSFFGMRLRGSGGDDTIQGYKSIANNADYQDATGALVIDMQASTDPVTGDWVGFARAADTVAGAGIGVDTLLSVQRVRASNFNDTIHGTQGDDVVEVLAPGSHVLYGRAGNNEVRFGVGTATDVVIDLGTTSSGTGFGGYLGSITKPGGLVDTLYDFNRAQGGAGNDQVFGTPGDDILAGGAGNNTLDGRGGVNTVSYRPFSGQAVPTKGVVVDLKEGLSGAATNSWDGTDTLLNIANAIGTQYADTITGADIVGGGLSLIRGDGGNDLLQAARLGANVMVSYSNSLTGVMVDLKAQLTTDDGWFGGQDTLVNIQAVRGSAFGDSLLGSARNETMEGAGGNDTLDGGKGADSLTGGAGNDRFIVDSAGDVVVEAAGEGTDTVESSVNLTLSDNVEVLVLAGNARVGNGNTLDNIIAGNAERNRMNGGDGNDSLTGGDGGDQLDGGAGNDTLDGGATADTLDGGLGADSMIGGLGNDIYFVDDAGDVLVEAPGGGSDLVRSGISWTLGADFEDLILSGTASSSGTGNALNNRIEGNGENNLLQGLDGRDTLLGGNGSDTLLGGGTADTLEGGGGRDSMDGGASGDLFRWSSSAHGRDTISGFSSNADDLEFSAAGFGGGLVAATPLVAAQFEINATGLATAAASRFIYNNTSGQLNYDADGSGAGAAVQIALFVGIPTLQLSDFTISL